MLSIGLALSMCAGSGVEGDAKHTGTDAQCFQGGLICGACFVLEVCETACAYPLNSDDILLQVFSEIAHPVSFMHAEYEMNTCDYF